MRRFKTLIGAVTFALLRVSILAAPADFTLRLGGIAFDPLQAEPQLPTGWDRSASAGPDLHLVQFDGPIAEGMLDLLREHGLEPVRYVYPNSYVVWGRTAGRRALQGASTVRWTGDFAPAFRVLPQWRDLGEPAVDVDILIYRGADTDAVVESIARLGGEPGSRVVVDDKLEIAGFSLPGNRIRAAARVPGVYSIQLRPTDGGSRGEVADQINAGNVDPFNEAVPGYQAWLAGLGLDGTGVTVAVVDEGVDDTHPDLLARMLPCIGDSCSPFASIHGTHVAGNLAGDGASGVLDANGFLRGLGVAPGASLVSQDYYPMMIQAGGLLQLMTDSSRSGATVSNNSWGTSVLPMGYDASAMAIDAGVRDADLERPDYQQMVYVLAINNGQGGTSTQGAPDEAKNTITVGATKAIGPDLRPDTNINDLASVSAHGPALDGRTIPHIVAPGCRVDGPYPDLGEGHQHNTRCGTSQAAPQVSGAVALFTEYYRNLPDTTGDPSPALVKAALLPVAHDLNGGMNADGVAMGHRPDSMQGWGRLDLASLVDPPVGSVLYFEQSRIFEVSGEEWMRGVTQIDPAEPMRVMLVWTDAPGHGLGGDTPALSNDLDLVVEANGETYHGNYFGTDGYSAIGGTADTLNNAEGVLLASVTGDASIRVVAANINSDGVPNYNDETDQDFALVCYNCAPVPSFALDAHPVTRDVCSPALTTYEIEVEQYTGYANDVTLTVLGVPAGAGAVLDVNPVAPGSSAIITFDPGTAVTDNHAMTVQGDSVDMSRSIPIYTYLRTAPPVAPTQVAPDDLATGVHPQPVLEWDPITWTDRFLVEIATDATFLDIVYTALENGTTHDVGITLLQDTTYYWRVRATNVCGYGLYSVTRSFTTGTTPDILLVDDDWDEPGIFPDYQGDYTAALNALGLVLGIDYDVWDVYDVYFGDQPDARTLTTYDKVIWFTGEEENAAGPDPDSDQVLGDWLDRMGCFLITSPDYVLARGDNGQPNQFMQERLGVASVSEDDGEDTVWAMGSVFGGLWVEPGWGLQNRNPDYSDAVTPDGTAELAFDGAIGPAGVNKDGAAWRTAFMGFGLERLGNTEMQDTLNTFLGWCDGLPALDGDLDGVLNGDDCVAADADVWGTPDPVTGLTLHKALYGFSWSQPVGGSGAVYDVLRSTDPTEWYDAACAASGISGTQAFDDLVVPTVPGELIFYLARVRNECGVAPMGENLDTSPRFGTACE